MLSPTRRLRSLGGLIVLGAALTAASAGAVSAASVTPTPIDDGNPTCAEFGSWDEVKADPPANAVFSDGTLTVTISNFVQSSSGTPGSFDWSSNIGVDAVFVKAGNDKHHLYVYAPESMGDTDLGPQSGTGNGISHISFCYDDDPAPSQPAPSQPAPSQPAPSQPAPSGGVAGATGTPTITLPPTDGLTDAEAGELPVPTGLLAIVIGLLAIVASVAIRVPARARR
jgi:hypothetical protein